MLGRDGHFRVCDQFWTKPAQRKKPLHSVNARAHDILAKVRCWLTRYHFSNQSTRAFEASFFPPCPFSNALREKWLGSASIRQVYKQKLYFIPLYCYLLACPPFTTSRFCVKVRTIGANREQRGDVPMRTFGEIVY